MESQHPAAGGTVFHEGESAVQERVGVRERVEDMGRRVIRDHMPDQHRAFFGQLPFLLIGAVDADAQPWASVLAGPPGFVQSPDPRVLTIDARPPPFDPLATEWTEGRPLGLLGIEPHTRRRNRLNGVIESVGPATTQVRVSQSFGNCPKYIQARKPEFVEAAQASAVVRRMTRLDADLQARVRAADTFFIATAHPDARADAGAARGADVSHRGGKPGFVRVEDDGTRLCVPDFVGNFLFNTIGNLVVNPRAGLLLIDFESGDLLYLAVRGAVIWDGPKVRAFEGAQRLLEFEVVEVRAVDAALPLRWGAQELSPFLAATGSWEAADTLGQ